MRNYLTPAFTDNQMNPKPVTGVLTESEVLLVEAVQGRRVLRSLLLPADARTPDGLLTYLWQTELACIWLMPATELARSITSAWFEQVRSHWNVVVHPHPRDPSKPTCVLLWPRTGSHQGSRRLLLAFPEHAGWGWELSDARSLLATVTYLDQALGRPICEAPELVAHQLLTELVSEHPVQHHVSTSNDRSLPTLEITRDLEWMRPLTLVEHRQKYLHKYTHLSLSLEAAMSTRLGIGEPEFSPNGRAYESSRSGLWRVNAERMGSVFDGKRLPSCVDGEWMSTPQVQCCREIGYQVQVQEGFYWQESQELLKGWATTLWQAGERLYTQAQLFRHAQGRTNASHTIAQLADLGVSILGRERTTGGWARPDWWTQLVGGSRARLFGHLVRLVRKGTMPMLVAGNAFWVVSNDPNPLTAVPGLVTARNWKGYSPGYADPLPLSSDLRETLRTAEHAGQLAQFLDALAGEVFPSI